MYIFIYIYICINILTAYIELCSVDAECLRAREDLWREGLVDLHPVHLTKQHEPAEFAFVLESNKCYV